MYGEDQYPKTTDKEQWHERAKAAYGAALKEGEQRMFVVPAYDYMGSEKDSGYGRHSAELVFVERRKGMVVDVRFFTGWDINFTPGSTYKPWMCSGYYYHYDDKAEASEYAHHTDECQLSGGTCYGEAGSALYGDVLMQKLINEGSPAIWEDIDHEFSEHGRGRKA